MAILSSCHRAYHASKAGRISVAFDLDTEYLRSFSSRRNSLRCLSLAVFASTICVNNARFSFKGSSECSLRCVSASLVFSRLSLQKDVAVAVSDSADVVCECLDVPCLFRGGSTEDAAAAARLGAEDAKVISPSAATVSGSVSLSGLPGQLYEASASPEACHK